MLKLLFKQSLDSMQNRRQFTRVLFSLKAILTIGEREFDVKILDISLNGALINLEYESLDLAKQNGVLSFQLDDTSVIIKMNAAVVYQKGTEIGVQCTGIDINSVCLLRRLIELNIEDDKQIHKELSQLTTIDD